MFLLITQILLWLLLGLMIWYVLLQLIPKVYLTWLGGILVLSVMLITFFYPLDPAIATGWSILSLPLRPLGLSLVIFFFTLISIKKNALTQSAKMQLWIALIILIVFSLPWVAERYERYIIQSNLAPTEVCSDAGTLRSPPRAGAIVLLAGAITQPNGPYRPERQVPQMSDRILETAQQYTLQREYGIRPRVLVSGRPRSFRAREANELTEAEQIKRRLANVAVPEDDIEALSNSYNIRESAQEVKALLAGSPLPNQTMILVASAVDVPRAKLTFEKLGLTVIPRASDLSEQLCQPRGGRIPIVDVLPNAAALLRSTRASEEFITLIYYFLRGWISPCGSCGDSAISG